jgi:hypothetical protein
MANGEGLLRLWYWLSSRRNRKPTEQTLLRQVTSELMSRGML